MTLGTILGTTGVGTWAWAWAGACVPGACGVPVGAWAWVWVPVGAGTWAGAGVAAGTWAGAGAWVPVGAGAEPGGPVGAVAGVAVGTVRELTTTDPAERLPETLHAIPLVILQEETPVQTVIEVPQEEIRMDVALVQPESPDVLQQENQDVPLQAEMLQDVEQEDMKVLAVVQPEKTQDVIQQENQE